jgi:integrase
LISWLTVLPWRQRNLREAKLANRESGGNLFKAQIADATTIARPGWVEEALKRNSHEAFWQFFFGAEETKTAHQVHALLPKQLIPLLKEYLQHYRPMLLNVTDPQTLFLNSAGRPISSEGMWMIVGNITRRYTGLRVNPHLFRDIFAVKWLEEHPEDYLTVSKILWHRNIQTTLRIYGRNFDESHGVRRVEDWLEARAALKSA